MADLLTERLYSRYSALGERWNQVAKTLGVYPSYVSDVLNGRRLPGPKFLKQLGLQRKVTIEYVELER